MEVCKNRTQKAEAHAEEMEKLAVKQAKKVNAAALVLASAQALKKRRLDQAVKKGKEEGKKEALAALQKTK